MYSPSEMKGSHLKFGPVLSWIAKFSCVLVFAGIYLALLSGCDVDWRSKFIRKSKTEVRPAQFQIDKVQRPYPELYREHFNFWKNWHRELIEDLGGNRKRELRDLRETRRHLESLVKYLQNEQAELVVQYVKDFDFLTARVRRERLPKIQYSNIKRRLDALLLRIDTDLHYKKMKDLMRPTPVPVDMERYQGEEPLVISAPEPEEGDLPIKPQDATADSFKDDGDTISYEEYRTTPLS